METLLKKASEQTQEAEVLSIKEESINIRYEDREIKKIDTKNTEGFSLRLIKDERLGTTCGTPPLDHDEMVTQTLTSAKYGNKVEFSLPNTQPVNTVKTYDDKIAKLSIEEMCRTGDTIIQKIMRLAPDLAPDLSISKGVGNVAINNSHGIKAGYNSTNYSIGVGFKIKGSKASVTKWDSSAKYFEFPDQKIEDLIKEYRLCDIKHSMTTRKMPVIFTPQSAWSLLYRVYAAINGDALYRGISPLADKIGSKIFDDQITVVDNPTMDFGTQSCPFDDEGISTYKKNIIEKGVFKEFIFDLATASKKKTKSTGNGFKRGMWGGGIEVPPNPVVANFTLLPGKMSMEEMIKDIKEGIIIDEVLGFHSGNIIQGEFSMNVGVGYFVQNGVIKGRAMDAMVAGNIYESFNKLVGLGNKLEITFVGYLPAMYFKEMSVAGK
ncbi:MAG: metallopeptidase TldD-related protein [Planctomycetota bacterium]